MFWIVSKKVFESVKKKKKKSVNYALDEEIDT